MPRRRDQRIHEAPLDVFDEREIDEAVHSYQGADAQTNLGASHDSNRLYTATDHRMYHDNASASLQDYWSTDSTFYYTVTKLMQYQDPQHAAEDADEMEAANMIVQWNLQGYQFQPSTNSLRKVGERVAPSARGGGDRANSSQSRDSNLQYSRGWYPASSAGPAQYPRYGEQQRSVSASAGYGDHTAGYRTTSHNVGQRSQVQSPRDREPYPYPASYAELLEEQEEMGAYRSQRY
jgi:hypothetical protein